MKRIILCLIILITTITLSGFTYYLTPSATDIVFGLSSGGANIWNRNPLGVWSNPAKLGYFEGISLGFSYDPWMEKYFDNNSYSASYITIGMKGIGIMLPMVNYHSKFGYNFEISDDVYDADGNFLFKYDYHAYNSEFALGINIIKFCNNLNNNELFDEIEHFSDLSLGYNYDLTYNQLYRGYIELSHEKLDYAGGFGMIWRISPLNQLNYLDYGYIKADLITSLYFCGITSEYFNSTNTAVSLRLALDKEIMKQKLDTATYNLFSDFSSNFVSVYASYDKIDEEVYDHSGYGFEFTILDIFSIRTGKDSDESEIFTGWGINLRYKEIFQLQMNQAKFSWGTLQKFQNKTDFMLNINFLNLMKMESQKRIL